MSELKPDRVSGTVSRQKRVGDTVVTVTQFYDLTEKKTKVDSHMLSGILTVVIALLLILRVGGVVLGLSTNFTFTSLLESLSRIKTIETKWISDLGNLASFTSNSKLLNTIMSFLISIIQVASWVSVSTLNLIHIIVMFVGIVFGVSI